MKSQTLFAMITVALSVMAVTPAVAAEPKPFTFVALGDMPYTVPQETNLKEMVGTKLQDWHARGAKDVPPFLIHYGDFRRREKGPACTQQLYEARRDQMLNLVPGLPVIFTPGDNDWTDCDGTEDAATAKPELASLALLKAVFYPLPHTNKLVEFASQPEQIENSRWVHNGTLFVTLHQVGTNNGRDYISPPPHLTTDAGKKTYIAKALKAVKTREGHNLAWLKKAFQIVAARDDILGVVVVIHADIKKADQTFRDAMSTQAGSKAGGKPVLLIHGDTSTFCIEKKSLGAPNLTRLNGPGDDKYGDRVEAAVIRVDFSGPEPFAVRGLLSTEKLTKCGQ